MGIVAENKKRPKWLKIKGIRWGPTGVDFKTFLREGSVGILVEKLYSMLNLELDR
jgi:hypothetical protein